ncbi:hypothetical protein FB45DRAFT_1069717 [Roridomyces roridus]|uniref:F-box domain-containing protein n=1 Tax=Roridomyces roridus TaxID=1738132 RepID=A0AAD7AZ01_9AGAR|nr:hypothetical protein FB45DRAFT_1069717 [Roridomyces roridus]
MSSAAELRQRIQSLSDAVARQREILRDLVQQHSVAQGQLNSILDPMTRLPLEISSEILLQSLPKPPTLATLSVFPRVSRAWRAIALATPTLWTTIRDEGIPPSKFPKVLGLWLARGRGFPISLSVRNLSTDTFPTTFAALKHDAQRIETMEWFIGPTLETSQSLDYGFAGLKSFTLGIDDKMIEFSCKWILDMLREIPLLAECHLLYLNFRTGNETEITHLNLRRLRLGEFGPNTGHYLLKHLTLPSLESFSSHIDLDELHTFLQRSPSPLLRSLHIHVRSGAGHLPSMLELVPGLTDLDIELPATRRRAPSFLDTLISNPNLLPALQRLVLEERFNHGADGYDRVLRFLSLRRASIRCFELSGWGNGECSEEFAAALREFQAEGINVNISCA